jgi:phosphate transport system substrate-binding protein
MKNLFKLLLVLLTILATNLWAAKKNITMAGSTTVLPIAQRCAEAFMDINPKINISVRGGGSGVGITALINKSVDIGLSSRTIKDKELLNAKQKGVNPKGTVIALDGLAVIVHPNNPVNEISIKTLKDIYTGKIKNWKVLGGPDKEIVVVSRDVASGTFEVFKERVLGGEKTREDALMLASNKAVEGTVKETPSAIGYVGIGYLSNDVKALKIEGVPPSVKTVKDGSYKLKRELYFYTNGTPKGLVKEFIDFVLSAQGQKLVTEVGFVPVN